MNIEIQTSESLQLHNQKSAGRIIKLSENDNCAVRMYQELCFFYYNEAKILDFMPSEKLKYSLLITLDSFPELTGRLNVLRDGSLEVRF